MFIGFLCSPAILSIAVFLFGLNGIRDVNPKQWIKDRWWLLGFAWILFYVISYFWSQDKDQWGISVQVKLPFLILPLAFTFMPSFTNRQKQLMTLGIGAITLAGVIYSLSFIFRDPKYLAEYKYSHLLPTPSRNDHICFSLSVTLYITWCVYCWPVLQKTARWLTAVLVLVFILYIHILASKTGIIAFYMFLMSWGVFLAFSQKWYIGIVVVVAIPLLFMLGNRYIRTFHDRIQYVIFSVFMLDTGDRSGNYGDIGRIWSYTISSKLIRQHPLTGVGSGDMLTEMKKGYDQWHPEVADQNRLVPHNQLLIVALSAGIPAMIVFAAWLLYPLTWLRRNRQSFFFFAIWLELTFYLMIDTGLEVQMGVFIFLFYILLMRKELPTNRPAVA